ncbi:hypothetical protein Taro_011125 [Colocasia esculenta]|uniref:Uncharacterized protein n=1 Tax=Colocasia esculenta TaxID=4460 RepID=A0A843U9Q4_COLES|nr:hypothetical protein [Colocasia esculenta]
MNGFRTGTVTPLHETTLDVTEQHVRAPAWVTCSESVPKGFRAGSLTRRTDRVAFPGVDNLVLVPDPEALTKTTEAAVSWSARRCDRHPASSGSGFPLARHRRKDCRKQQRRERMKQKTGRGEGKEARRSQRWRVSGSRSSRPRLVPSL